MDRHVVVWFLLVVLAVSSASSPALSQETSAPTALSQPEAFDQTSFEITVYQNGSARWAIKHHRRLANDTEAAQFDSFATRFENESTDLFSNFEARANRLTAVAANATGRQMQATSFYRDAETTVTANFEDRGTIVLGFTWTNFARLEGDRILVGDVFGDTFYIAADQALLFERGPKVSFVDAQPEPSARSNPDSLAASDSVTWKGERQFTQERPAIELQSRDRDGSSSRENVTTANETASENPMRAGGAGADMLWIVGILVLVIGVASAVAYRTGSLSLPWGDDAATEGTESPAEPSPETEAQAAIPEDELLSDSDRVRNLLEDNGGRMKQVNIVDETDWSKSKVSMLLSDMEDDGEISKLRVGRENIISLSGHEPDAAGSPFDDED